MDYFVIWIISLNLLDIHLRNYARDLRFPVLCCGLVPRKNLQVLRKDLLRLSFIAASNVLFTGHLFQIKLHLLGSVLLGQFQSSPGAL